MWTLRPWFEYYARAECWPRPSPGGRAPGGGCLPAASLVLSGKNPTLLRRCFRISPCVAGLGALGNKWPRQGSSAALNLVPWYRVSEIPDSFFKANCPFGRREIFIVKVPSLVFFFFFLKHLIKVDMIHENNQSPKRQILVKKN